MTTLTPLPPTLLAKLAPCGCCVTVWCVFCRRRHHHGWPGGAASTHRVAHCVSPQSPYLATGYFLALEAG